MRRDELYLTDIVEASDAIQRFLSGGSREAFMSDELLQSAVLQKLTVIGEAASKLSQEFRDLHPEVEWSDIVAFRNIAVHAYFAVDWPIVWVTASQEVLVLRSQVAKIIETRF